MINSKDPSIPVLFTLGLFRELNLSNIQAEKDKFRARIDYLEELFMAHENKVINAGSNEKEPKGPEIDSKTQAALVYILFLINQYHKAITKTEMDKIAKKLDKFEATFVQDLEKTCEVPKQATEVPNRSGSIVKDVNQGTKKGESVSSLLPKVISSNLKKESVNKISSKNNLKIPSNPKIRTTSKSSLLSDTSILPFKQSDKPDSKLDTKLKFVKR